MNFQMLQSFNESTLKQMIIDLHAENKKLKDSYNEKLDSKDKEISELIDIANERQMDVQLYKRKYEENKAVEEKIKEHDKEILEKVREIIDLQCKVQELQIDLKISKDRCDKLYKESKSCPQVQIVQWMDQNCIEADNVLSKDGITEIAPTDYATLYYNYVEWCQEEELLNRADKKTFKTEILDWQQKSKYGLCVGKSKKESDGMINGYLSHPLINLKIV